MAETNTQKFYIGEDIRIQFPPLTPEQNSQRCKENRVNRTNFDGTRKSRSKRAELTKRQWQNPDFREKVRQKASERMAMGLASTLGKRPKTKPIHSFADRNAKLKKCREMIEKLSLIGKNIDSLSDEELDSLYYKLCQW